MEFVLRSECQKRHLIEDKLQNEREKRMAMKGAIAIAFQQYFGKVAKVIVVRCVLTLKLKVRI